MTKTAIIFTHEANEGPGLFGDILKDRGFEQKIVFTPGETPGKAAESADLLLVMGGPQGAYETAEYPYLKAEIEIIKKRFAVDKSTLGICLGAQLMAAALGAKVYKGSNGPEFGWIAIKAHGEGPARHLDGVVFHAHGDTYDLPQGAKVLASSDKYANQAFSYGRSIGLQCHPEVTAEQLEAWLPASEWLAPMERETGKKWNAADFLLETSRNIATLNEKARLFFNEWLESVGL